MYFFNRDNNARIGFDVAELAGDLKIIFHTPAVNNDFFSDPLADLYNFRYAIDH